MTNHKHLRITIEDVYSNNNQLNENLTLKLINEFRYSNLYIAAKRDNGTLNFITYEYDDLKLTPLFTDHDEFNKFFGGEDIQLLQNPFEVYQNILKSTDIEGYILNPSSEKYLFTEEFILSINNIPKSSYYTTDAYSSEELYEIYQSMDNADLKEFLDDSLNIGDYEALFEKLSDSTLLTLMLSDLDFNDKIIDLKIKGPIAGMYTDNVGGVYATIFSGTDEIRKLDTDRHKYAQVVNLSMLVNFILSEDMDGLIINPATSNVLIPRGILLKYSLGFEKYANDMRLCDAIYYMFSLD